METNENIIINLAEDIERYAKNGVLDVLLSDQTTEKNIVWATAAYEERGSAYSAESEITREAITKSNLGVIKTRVEKAIEDQASLTKSFAEVFTPTWICKLMIDEADSLNSTGVDLLSDVKEKRSYIRSRILEITCGEAPFITNRYDAADGTYVPFEERIGILDRKLTIVKDISTSRNTWKRWAEEALKSVYGYEYQGDNLLIARINVLRTMESAIQDAGYDSLRTIELKNLAKIITWNFWQMDGLDGCVPFKALNESFYQPSIFDLLLPETDSDIKKHETVFSKIFDWRSNAEIEFRELQNGGTIMKFDFIIGNPPYQEEVENNGRMNPIYNNFMDSANEIGNEVVLITPGRFLFNAGQTPKTWNKKMLSDPHFKVLQYFPNSKEVFPTADIKGGVAITRHSATELFSPIGVFTPFRELNTIITKVRTDDFCSLSDLVSPGVAYSYSEEFRIDFPNAEELAGKSFDLRTNTLEKLNNIIYFEEKPEDSNEYVQIFGLLNGKRVYRWVKSKYVVTPDNFGSYKVFIPKSNGSGALGEVLSTPLIGQPLIGQPLIGHTQTFISIGNFKTEKEAEACLKYIKSKFARTMLGVLKITQDNPAPKWKYVPLQDFTSMSDIDWSQSISDIDKQLYAKYGLTEEEINFIETHVKEMD